ncbi:carboxypeptidase regulatory-like domain-containing protein [Candidatus Micrarchaeota archaeon]|nr:carboxypeptidase regulatory-like domain-containing protein [Candidatus Micrarchaeota archaeon]
MNLRHAALFILLLQLAPLAYAAIDCSGYHDMFTVRVLDGNRRPVENASVTVKYDRGQSFGDKYFTTPPKLTDASGQILYDIYNGGTNTRPIDCNIEINATAGGTKKSITIVAGQHGPTVDVILGDVFGLKFFVRDQFRAALPNATVNVGNYSGTTDRYGMFYKQLKKGVYPYFASYVDASQAGSLNITNDTEFEVLFPHYRITLDISDDTGKPLPATLTIFNKTFEMQDGHFENEKTFGDAVPYNVNYRGIITEGTIYPATEPIVNIRYDINAPQFGNITPQEMNGKIQLNIEVWDPNQYPSGLDMTSIKMFYKVEPSDATAPWNSAIVYTTGRNKFTADFQDLPADSIIKFRAEVKDKAGNRAEKEGKFSTFAVTPPENNTGNQTNPPPSGGQEQGIPLIYILGGAILLLLALYLVFRMKSKPA